jgi:ribulose-bisphosphate carboxylase large chain
MKTSNTYLKYVHIGDRPDFKSNVIASYLVEKSADSKLEDLAFLGSIAAESSTGTWIEVSGSQGQSGAVSGRVYEYDEGTGIVKIAYPLGLFEPGNVSQLMTVVAGNAFGLADLSRLKLLDVSLPPALVEALPGPALGVDGIYRTLQITEPRPIVGAIMKPKCGLSAREHAEICYQAWTGLAESGGEHGVDMVKDDEALTHQPSFGSDFYVRMSLTMERLKKSEDVTGHRKVYVPNVTHSNVFESIRRAEYVKRLGGTAVMVDFVIGGCTLLQSLRDQNLGLVIHGHRTLFAAMHRGADFGVNYMVWAKLFRLIGGDQVHIGTPGLGVMSASRAAVKDLANAMWADKFTPTSGQLGALPQDFRSRKSVAPICGAGLDPLTTAPIAEQLGSKVIVFAGGGVHGHPEGTAAGAASLRESVLAYLSGHTMLDWAAARDRRYLHRAVEFFNHFDKQSPNDGAKANQ